MDNGLDLAPSTALRLGCDAAAVALFKDQQGNPLSVGGVLSVEDGIGAEPGSICSEWLGDRLNMKFVIGALIDGDP